MDYLLSNLCSFWKIKLVHYDVHGWEPISLAELKRLNQNLTDQLGEAKKWVADTNAPPGGPGEKKAREAVQTAQGRFLKIFIFDVLIRY